jgi:hypothetical protein
MNRLKPGDWVVKKSEVWMGFNFDAGYFPFDFSAERLTPVSIKFGSGHRHACTVGGLASLNEYLQGYYGENGDYVKEVCVSEPRLKLVEKEGE